MCNLKSIVFLTFFLVGTNVFGQSYNPPAEEINENSVRPVHPSDVMFKKAVWRRIDLSEKQNKGFFASGNEISKLLVNAVKEGIIKPYLDDSLVNRMSLEEFTQNLQDPSLATVEEDMGFESDFGFGGDAQEEKVVSSTEFIMKDISIIDLKEDVIFDKQRSRMYFDIQAVALVIPGSRMPTGFDRNVCWLSYKDVIENVFSKDKSAIWYNRQNSAEHRTLTDAFELRLFSAKITKVANPDNSPLEDIYGEALLSTYKAESELMEFEHNLWEY